ncbi:unnamed protein product [Victoria cruziana]
MRRKKSPYVDNRRESCRCYPERTCEAYFKKGNASRDRFIGKTCRRDGVGLDHETIATPICDWKGRGSNLIEIISKLPEVDCEFSIISHSEALRSCLEMT